MTNLDFRSREACSVSNVNNGTMSLVCKERKVYYII